MILSISHKESATLTLNLSVMRKSYKKLFKNQYKDRRDVLMLSYDYILDSVKKALQGQNEVNEIHLNNLDVEVLCEILRSYIEKLDGMKLESKEDLEQLEILKGLYARCKRLLIA